MFRRLVAIIRPLNEISILQYCATVLMGSHYVTKYTAIILYIYNLF
jgi:hypothetical protein